MTTGGKNEPVTNTQKKSSHWSFGLIRSFSDPNCKVLEDDEVIVIKDLYPKATHHFLVCPKEDIENPKCLKPEHIPLLKHMERVAGKIAKKHSDKNFLIGFHAVQSMARLHLHVISDDFNSSHLKTKKHWNSFNSDYFIPSSVFIERFEAGELKHASKSEGKELLKKPLKCHKCDYFPKTMPELKTHILTHF